MRERSTEIGKFIYMSIYMCIYICVYINVDRCKYVEIVIYL